MSGLLGGTSSLAFPLPAAAPARVFVQTNPPLLQQEDPFTDTGWADSPHPKTCHSPNTPHGISKALRLHPQRNRTYVGKPQALAPAPHSLHSQACLCGLRAEAWQLVPAEHVGAYVPPKAASGPPGCCGAHKQQLESSTLNAAQLQAIRLSML